MKIEYELNEVQTKALEALLSIPQNSNKSPNEAARLIMVQALIQAEKQRVEYELTKAK